MRRLALILAVCIFIQPAIAHADDDLPLGFGDRGQKVVTVQYSLRAKGYALAVDGTYGPVTAKAVVHWQKANGLTVDGIVGPITWESLAGAVRVDPPKPTFASACDEMRWYRQQAGLPEVFDAIGYRESRCRNDVRTWCCRGWFQLHQIIWRDHRMIAPLATCGATATNIMGTDEASKRRQACAAKALYDAVGLVPWAI